MPICFIVKGYPEHYDLEMVFLKSSLLLSAHKGVSTSASNLATITRSTLPGRISTTGQNMYIKFDADGSSHGKGFLATISLVGKFPGNIIPHTYCNKISIYPVAVFYDE